MQIIKIPFSVKFYFFFELLFFTISLLLLDFGYGFFGANYIFFASIIGIIILIAHLFFLFKYFKNPQEYSNIVIGFIIFFIILYLIGIKYSGFSIIPILYNLFFLYKFINLKKSLNKKIKDIEYTTDNQYKSVLITYGIIILLLVIFYFSYYSIPAINFKNIDDSYFITPKQYLNISEKENGSNNLKEYSSYLSNLEYTEDKNFYSSLFNTGYSIKNINFDINKINKIDNLRKGINEIINKKSIVQKINEDFFSLQGISMVSRESFYNVLYYLEKGNETKAINYLIENYKFGNMLMTGYGSIINFIVGITVQMITLEELNYILDNYDLDKNSLISIKENIKLLPKINDGFKNTIIYDYHTLYNTSTNLETSKVKYSSIIFASKKYFKEGLKNIAYNNIKKNYNYCRNTSDKIRKSLITKLILKKYPISTYYLMISCFSLSGYDKDLEYLISKENMLLEKIDKLLEKKSDNWKTLLKEKNK